MPANAASRIPGLLERAAREHGLDLGASWIVGDRYADLEMAHAVGARGILVMTGYGRGEYELHHAKWVRQPDALAENLTEAVRQGADGTGGDPVHDVGSSANDGAERYLVVRLTALGDILHTLPAVAALRAAHRNARIDWVVDRKWAPVLEGSPAINNVIPFDRRSALGAIDCVRRLRQNKYTCAIDFQGLYKSSVLAVLSGAPRRIGFDRGWAREDGAALLYSERIRPMGRHVAELNYSLAEAAGASRPAMPEYPLRVPAGGAASVRARLAEVGIERYIVVAPAGSWAAKCWPAERYGEFCREFEKRNGLPVVVIHGPGEESIAQEVCLAAKPAHPLAITTTLEELMGLLAHARCVVAADSGPLHLAAALGTPVVGVYGPTDPLRNGPFAPGAIVVSEARAGEISYKRRTAFSPAMLRISVEKVLDAVENCLRVSA